MSAGAAAAVARQFALSGEVRGCERLPGGHINDSWRVTTDGSAYLLQRLNARVFPRPTEVMENIARVTRHLRDRVRAAGVPDARRRALTLLPTRDGADWLADARGNVWRCYALVTGAHTRDRARSPAEAHAAARAFGEFLIHLSDCPGPPLFETIPGFHDTAGRFAALETALWIDPLDRAATARPETEAVLAHRGLAQVLPPLVAGGEVPVRIAHNDAKIANVLFDDVTGEALCVVDLDTVMPGSALHDFGDLVRSMASPTDEDETDLTRVAAREEYVAALAGGWLAAAGPVLTSRERSLLVFAGRLITLEQAVRFLTDHLTGDRYYRIARPGHNLDRARTQIRLFASLTEQESALERLVAQPAGRLTT